MTADACSALDRLAQGTTRTDVLRRALAMADLFDEARRAGNRIAIVDSAGRVLTLVVTV